VTGGVLAYVFWHRPAAGVDAGAYEDALRGFHAALEGVRSASFRVAALPFEAGGAGGSAGPAGSLRPDGSAGPGGPGGPGKPGGSPTPALPAGYEDWYLVADWAALGELNATAVDAAHRGPHDAAAGRAGAGWGGVYRLVGGGDGHAAGGSHGGAAGAAEPPAAVHWSARRPDGAGLLWQRQMVLGPAPEFCLAATNEQQPGRTRVA
jgi:hypothetical protein